MSICPHCVATSVSMAGCLPGAPSGLRRLAAAALAVSLVGLILEIFS